MFKFVKIFHENVIFIMSFFFFFSNEVTLSLEKKKKRKLTKVGASKKPDYRWRVKYFRWKRYY